MGAAAVVERKHISREGILSLQILCQEREHAESIATGTQDDRSVTFGLESIEILTEHTAGPETIEFLKQSICETSAHQALEAERLARKAQQVEAENHYAALLERATRAETYSESLRDELKKKRDDHQSLLTDREREQIAADKYQTALLERAQRAETYNESLRVELKKQQDEYRALLAVREQAQATAEAYHATLLERAQRAETYNESLRVELKKHQDEYLALLMAREREQTEADKYRAALLERAQRAETYNESLTLELQKRK